MRNRELAADYVRRAEARIQAIEVLFRAESWADVVRESQEAVELALKGCSAPPASRRPAFTTSRTSCWRSGTGFRDLQGEWSACPGVEEPPRDRELAFYGAET